MNARVALGVMSMVKSLDAGKPVRTLLALFIDVLVYSDGAAGRIYSETSINLVDRMHVVIISFRISKGCCILTYVLKKVPYPILALVETLAGLFALRQGEE